MILLQGYVKADALETEVANILENAFINSLSVNELGAMSIDTYSIDTDSIRTDSLTVVGTGFASCSISMGELVNASVLSSETSIDLSHSHKVTVNDDGTITLGEVATTGGSFKIADTAYYKNGVSAARESGYNSGYTDAYPASITTEVAYTKASNQYDILATVNLGDKTTRSFVLTPIVATSAYNAGYDDGYAAGYQAAKDAVKVTAGISSWSNPSQGWAMVRYWGRAAIGDEQIGYASGSDSRNVSNYG